MMTSSIKWKHFPCNWSFVRGIHLSPVNSPHKGQWHVALMFSLICTRTNGWKNNRDVGDLRRRRIHYDVSVHWNHDTQHNDIAFNTVYPKKYAHGFVLLCFVVVMQSFIMNSHEVFIHIHQGCFAGTGAIVRLPQCQWSKPDGYGIISQCITTTKHSKAKTVCIFLGIYCTMKPRQNARYFAEGIYKGIFMNETVTLMSLIMAWGL